MRTAVTALCARKIPIPDDRLTTCGGGFIRACLNSFEPSLRAYAVARGSLGQQVAGERERAITLTWLRGRAVLTSRPISPANEHPQTYAHEIVAGAKQTFQL